MIGGNDRKIIEDSIDEFHKYTCIKFKERRAHDTDYVYFTNSNTGCWSSVGRIGGRQEVSVLSMYKLSKRSFYQTSISFLDKSADTRMYNKKRHSDARNAARNWFHA